MYRQPCPTGDTGGQVGRVCSPTDCTDQLLSQSDTGLGLVLGLHGGLTHHTFGGIKGDH